MFAIFSNGELSLRDMSFCTIPHLWNRVYRFVLEDFTNT